MQLEHTETLQLDYELPEYPEIDPRYRRAPRRESAPEPGGSGAGNQKCAALYSS